MVPLTRQRSAQQPPSVDLDQFPPRSQDDVVYRFARRAPWWFCTDGACRFDLMDADGLGTLYAGTDIVTGVLEAIGAEFLGRPVSRSFLSERTVWALSYDRSLELADTCHARARGFGVTNELSSMVPYTVPQAWALAFAKAGWDGVSYRARYVTAPHATAVAVFDEAGSHDWPATRVCDGGQPEVVETLGEVGVAVVDPPYLAQLDVR